MIILTTQKKNHEKISTQYKAVVYWMGTVFSPKMPLFFLATQVSSHIATAPLDLGMKYLWFWGPQTYYYLNLRGQVNLWYSHFHQEQHMRQHCDSVCNKAIIVLHSKSLQPNFGDARLPNAWMIERRKLFSFRSSGSLTACDKIGK